MKPKSDGEVYEDISRLANPEIHEEIKQLMLEWAQKQMDKTERPKKPYYRKERWCVSGHFKILCFVYNQDLYVSTLTNTSRSSGKPSTSAA